MPLMALSPKAWLKSLSSPVPVAAVCAITGNSQGPTSGSTDA